AEGCEGGICSRVRRMPRLAQCSRLLLRPRPRLRELRWHWRNLRHRQRHGHWLASCRTPFPLEDWATARCSHRLGRRLSGHAVQVRRRQGNCDATEASRESRMIKLALIHTTEDTGKGYDEWHFRFAMILDERSFEWQYRPERNVPNPR